MHTITTRLLAIATVTVLLFPFARNAEAHYCTGSCNEGARVCGGMATNVYKGCRFVCLANFPADPAGRKACVATCRGTLLADRAACETDGETCQALCATAAVKKCADDVCSYVYKDCREAVRQATRACVKAAGTDGVAVQACIEPGNLMNGTGRLALDDCMTTDLAICIAGC